MNQIKLEVKIREKNESQENSFPAVLYGPKIKNQNLSVPLKDFEKVLKEAGESSLVDLDIGDKKFKVLIHDIQRDPVKGNVIHADFYQPQLDHEIEATVPLVFEGEAPAIKNLFGTLVKNIHELEVKALPENLPHEIKVNVEALETFENEIKISDLVLPKGVKVLKESGEVIVKVMPPQKVEEELEKPIEEKVEDIEKVEERKPEEVVEAEVSVPEQKEKK